MGQGQADKLELVAEYIYRDETGAEIARKQRYNAADGGKTYLWRRDGKLGLGGPTGLKVTELPLYGFHAWRAAAEQAGHWLVVEGEKAQEAAVALAIPAVGTGGATTTPADEQLTRLLPHEIYLFPDNDEPGRKHMRTIGERLVALGAEHVYVIEWEDAPPGGDIADFVERYRDRPDQAQAMRDLFEGIWTFADWVADWLDREQGPAPPADRPCFTAADVARMLGKVRWLWPNWVPLGGVTLLASEPNCGKSMFALHLARVLWEGPAWPDGAPHEGDPAAGVIWVEADNNHQAVPERMEGWGLPPERLLMPFELRHPDLGSAEDLELLAATMARHEARLVVVDTLAGVHALDENSSEMKHLIDRLGDLARDFGAAFILCHHYRKRSTEGGANRPIDRARGSSAIMGAVRYAIAMEPTPSGVIVTPAKATYSAKSELRLCMTIAEDGVKFEAAPEGAERGRRQFEWERAAEFLREKLAAGARPRSELMAEAASRGLNENALEKAFRHLKCDRTRGAHSSLWALPDPASDTPQENGGMGE